MVLVGAFPPPRKKLTQIYLKTSSIGTQPSARLHESVALSLHQPDGTGPYNGSFDPIVDTDGKSARVPGSEQLTRRGLPGVWTYVSTWLGAELRALVAKPHNSAQAILRDLYVAECPKSKQRQSAVERDRREWYRRSAVNGRLTLASSGRHQRPAVGACSSRSITRANLVTLLEQLRHQAEAHPSARLTQAALAYLIRGGQRRPARLPTRRQVCFPAARK